MAVSFGPVEAKVELVGAVYWNGNALIVGDTDAVRFFLEKWGGGRRNGRVVITFEPMITEAVENSSPRNE